MPNVSRKTSPPLKRVAPLEDAARYFATDMGQDNYPEPDVPYITHATYDRVNGELVFVCTFLLALYDFSGNHVVDVDDIQMVAAHWGEASTC